MTDEDQEIGLNGLFEEEAAEAEEPKGEEPEEPTVDEPSVEEPEEPETPSDKEPTLVPVAAVQDLRRKNRELKEQLEEANKYRPKDNTEPDMYEDPEGWKAWNRNQIESEYVQRSQAEQSERIESSRSKMLEVDDYIDAENEFMVHAQRDQDLRDQMLNHKDPARFAYEKGKEFKEQREKAIIDKYLAQNPDKAKKPVPKLSLATATAPPNTVEVEEEEDLKDMFAGQGY